MRLQKTICILADFGDIGRNARVLRQIAYLSQHYNLIIAGHQSSLENHLQRKNIQWILADPPKPYERVLQNLLLVTAKLWQPSLCYELRYWLRRDNRQIFNQLKQVRADIILANEWTSLPIGWKLAALWNVPLILDLHEYGPLMSEDYLWQVFVAPMVWYYLRQYSQYAQMTITVAQTIARRYHQEFGFLPIVVHNAPDYRAVTDHGVDPFAIRMIHHGFAIKDRKLERMIDTIRYCDERYHLSFMLVSNSPSDQDYIRYLQNYANRVAPGRVTFLDPVAPDQIVSRIASFDIGFFLLKPTNYNYSEALPNKLFDFIHAGLAVCVGPSPGMAAFVREWQCGVVAPSFEPVEVAATLNRLGVEEIRAMRQAARVAAAHVNAQTEMRKVVELCNRLLKQE